MLSLDYCLYHPATEMATRSLWPAIKVIGVHKLALRQRHWPDLSPAMPEFRRCNQRIDELLEQEWQRRPRKAEVTA